MLLKSIKIFQSYNHKCTTAFIYGSQCTYGYLQKSFTIHWSVLLSLSELNNNKSHSLCYFVCENLCMVLQTNKFSTNKKQNLHQSNLWTVQKTSSILAGFLFTLRSNIEYLTPAKLQQLNVIMDFSTQHRNQLHLRCHLKCKPVHTETFCETNLSISK